MMNVEIFDMLMSILAPLITMFAIWGVTKVSGLISAQTEKISNETLRNSIEGVNEEASRIMLEAVRYTNQKFVDDAKANAEDGKLTPEQIWKAMQSSKDYFLGHMSDNALGILVAGKKPFDEWIEELMISKVDEVKSSDVGKKLMEMSSPN